MKTDNILSCKVAEELGIKQKNLKTDYNFRTSKVFVDTIRF
jgi:hypothetical protein